MPFCAVELSVTVAAAHFIRIAPVVQAAALIAPDDASCVGVNLLPPAAIIAPNTLSCASRLALSLVPQVSAEAPTSGFVQP